MESKLLRAKTDAKAVGGSVERFVQQVQEYREDVEIFISATY